MADSKRKLVRRLTKLSMALLPEAAGKRAGHWLRGGDERRRFQSADLVVLSHAKSGRTWVRAMLSRLFTARYGLPESQLMEFADFHAVNAEIPKILFTHGHYLAETVERTPSAGPRILLLVRHPCDIAVSQYFHFTKRTKAYKRELHGMDSSGDVDMFEFVMQSPMGLPEIVAYLNEWEGRLRGRTNALVVRYEELRAEPEKQLAGICGFFGLPFDAGEIERAVEFASFESLKEKERTGFFAGGRLAPTDPDDPDSYKVRRAKVGGYRDYFDETQLGEMEAFLAERLAPTLRS